MYPTRLVQLLFVALALACLSQAVKYDSDGLMIPRQDEGDDSLLPTLLPGDDGDDDAADTSSVPGATNTGEVPVPTPTEEPDPTTTAPEEPSSTTTDEEETTTEEPSEPTTTQPEPTSTTTDDSPSSTTDAPEPTSTNDGGNDESTTTEEPVVTTSVETVTRTNSDGSEETMTTSHVSTSTPEPHEDGGDGGDGGGGLDKNTRNIVIGVVVGVGGAILLGALGLVAWRIRSRKKAAEENDTLMDYNAGYTPVDKSEPPSSAAGTNPSTGPARSPFQSTLDTYHQPTQVNASSNF